MLEEFEKFANEIKFEAPKIKLISNVTGEFFTEVLDGAYWSRHVRESVRFESGIKALVAEGVRVFLEVGAGRTLVGMAQECVGEECVWLGSIKKGRSEADQILESAGHLYAKGVKLNWMTLTGDGQPRQKVTLPTYPFQRKRFWAKNSLAVDNVKGLSPDNLVQMPLQNGNNDKFENNNQSKTASVGQAASRISLESKQEVEEFIHEKVKEILVIDSNERLNFQANFSDLGMDSILGVLLRNTIGRELALPRELPRAVTLQHPSISALSIYVFGELNSKPQVEATPQTSPPAATSSDLPITQKSAALAIAEPDSKLVKPERNEELLKRWIFRWQNKESAKLRLLCFHYAGGGAHVFRDWLDRVPSTIEVCPIQLPGRMNRINETPFHDMNTLVDHLVEDLNQLFDEPFALLGYSFGALIAFELAQRLRILARPVPQHLFVAAARAPQTKPKIKVSDLSDEAILVAIAEHYSFAILKELGPELKTNNELRTRLLRALRADMILYENYTYSERPPLDLPISAFGGFADKVASPEEMKLWGTHTAGTFFSKGIEGGHFFIHSPEQSAEAFLNAVIAELDSIKKAAA